MDYTVAVYDDRVRPRRSCSLHRGFAFHPARVVNPVMKIKNRWSEQVLAQCGAEDWILHKYHFKAEWRVSDKDGEHEHTGEYVDLIVSQAGLVPLISRESTY
jgi:hypothetical protein